MSATTKISVNSLSDLKNTTDDALPNYLTSLRFRQSHSKTDVRLALGFSAVAIAGTLFYFDWKHGWDVTKPYTLPAVIAYFVLNTVFTAWVYLVEGGSVFEGEGKSGRIKISSSVKKHIPIYNLSVTFQPTPYSSNPPQTIKIRAPFTRWFSSDGYFIAKPFQQWLASEIPVVGAADPSKVVEEIGRGNQSEAERVLNVGSGNVLEVLEQLKRGAGVSGVEAAGGRRRKN
ncbi:hypothetical protein GQ43DRAFT_190151 [Delitschia confertaspora ATCC 74209]|uniref:Signal peptidase complex subunit 2 n=1 Tax=Delitschia confertaspora ATCC 74209 TaxID=1513339 RepID=A0A9P4JE75_9PLEO|nr:hypothetical protein GQ43DRAFT_190151 [Delitschia confertaspora ATCC 74209]